MKERLKRDNPITLLGTVSFFYGAGERNTRRAKPDEGSLD